MGDDAVPIKMADGTFDADTIGPGRSAGLAISARRRMWLEQHWEILQAFGLTRRLPARDMIVLKQHNGIAGDPCLTHEHLARAFSITRARVAQIEQRAIGRLARGLYNLDVLALTYQLRLSERAFRAMSRGGPWSVGRVLFETAHERGVPRNRCLSQAVGIEVRSKLALLGIGRQSFEHGWGLVVP